MSNADTSATIIGMRVISSASSVEIRITLTTTLQRALRNCISYVVISRYVEAASVNTL